MQKSSVEGAFRPTLGLEARFELGGTLSRRALHLVLTTPVADCEPALAGVRLLGSERLGGVKRLRSGSNAHRCQSRSDKKTRID